MSDTKKAVNLEGLQEKQKKYLEGVSSEVAVNSRGTAGDIVLEPVPEYLSSDSETVYRGKNNSWIVLGKDRPSNRLSGYGGKAHTQCGAIDIVVGRMASKPLSVSNDQKVYVDPDFTKDSARIYLSQKADIDDYFKLADGKIGNVKTRSAIGLKADQLRFIGREGIKFVTGTDRTNSQGADIKEIHGIDIIAGNSDKELQPMVKGKNLEEALAKMVKHLDDLNGIVDSLLMSQMQLNAAVTNHFHISPFYGAPTSPSPTVVAAGTTCALSQLSQVKQSLVAHKTNLVAFKMTYLTPAGQNYISSRYNNVN